MRIFDSLTDLIGKTPMLRISRYCNATGINADVLVKIEAFNPGGSIKDRIALGMLTDAEERGVVRQGSVIVEPTSGNTGVGLAMISAIKGYHLILTMPETMSEERKKLLRALGAELILTPGKEGMKGAIERAKQLVAETPGAFMPQQFDNPANPQSHAATTAEEIWNDTQGQLDAIICGVGTGGTITGIGKTLKLKKPSLKVIAVEPFDSSVLSGYPAGSHKIQGIGAGFVPSVLDTAVIDDIVRMRHEDAYEASRTLAKKEGLLVGISSGAAVAAAAELSRRPEYAGKQLVVILPDTGERYLSTELY